MNQKITPFLWFDSNAEEAINFYINVFSQAPNARGKSKLISVTRYEKGMEVPNLMEGKVLTAVFQLQDQKFMALDGGPDFKFNEAISLYVECEDQNEVDYFWQKLSNDPTYEQCGWLKDKYGVSWQIIPKKLGELINDTDRKKAMRVTNALLKMKKINISDLERAFTE